jgi:hypothetical protein
MDLIDNFSYVTFDLARLHNSNISKLYISDKPQLNSYSSGMYGVTPYIFETAGSQFVDVYYQN